MEVAISWIAVSAAAVCCYWLKLRYAREGTPSAEESDRLREEVDELRHDLNAVHADVVERVEDLTDRLDFTERLLTRAARECEGAREHTPV